MKKVFTLATMLPLTVGHKFLIDFCIDYAAANGLDTVEVLLNSRPQEPMTGVMRENALKDTFPIDYHNSVIVKVYHYPDDVPQNPSEHPDFWNFWRDLIRAETGCRAGDILITSETYGVELAKVLECEFVPCDIARQTVDAKATRIREDIVHNFGMMVPALQDKLRKRITIFGQESTGKTTMAKRLAKELNGVFVPEWAREYLELVGPDVTAEKMANIVSGQYALQESAKRAANGKPFLFQDTDLFSTLGYYRFWNHTSPERCERLARKTQSDLYIVMNDGIPFEKDILRYGDNKRETDRQYWIDLLEEFKCPYYVVQSTDRDEQYAEIEAVVMALLPNMKDFIRT